MKIHKLLAQNNMENPGIDSGTFQMQIGRSAT